jgi:hypothetical protein
MGGGTPRRVWRACEHEDGEVARLLRGMSSAAGPGVRSSACDGLSLRQRSMANNDGAEVGGTGAWSCRRDHAEIRRSLWCAANAVRRAPPRDAVVLGSWRRGIEEEEDKLWW